MFKKTIAALVLALGLCAGSLSAHAGSLTGYVCTTFLSTWGSYGTYGAVSTNVSTAPHCGGTFVGNVTLCSAGATANRCYSGSSYWFPDRQSILAQYQLLATATMNGARVSFMTGPCLNNASDTTCAGSVTFY